MRSLDIYFHGIKAGQLTENIPGKLYSFKYFGSYLQQPCGAISVTLPLTDKVYESDKLFPFFANMLPEGVNKRIVCREHKIDENDLFGLLNCFSGKDIIGAITVKIPENE